MAAFDVLDYMRTLESLLRIAEQAWLFDEDTLNTINKLSKVLGINKINIDIEGDESPESLILYHDKTEEAVGLIRYDFVHNDRKISCTINTKQPNRDFPAELLAGINTLYEIVRMLVIRELNRRKEEASGKIDLITGVSTKTLFTEYVNSLYEDGTVKDYSVVGFGLRSMAELNRQVGNDNGNKLMAAYVKGLQDILSDNGLVARIGGINFCAVFPRARFEEVAVYLSGKVVTIGSDFEGKVMSACAGFYHISEGCKNVGELNEIISSALHNALKNPVQPFIIYDEKLQQADKDEKYIARIFQEALENEEFKVYYQPKTELKKYCLHGAEALCRWYHEGKVVLPYRFIPVLENNGDIVRLDFYMIEHVCRDIRRWIDEKRPVVNVSINLSRCHLGDPDLLLHITEIIDKYEIPHSLIEIELTETTTEVDYKELKDLVTGLKEVGLSTSVDDFGVGYSSMNLLHELPWSIIKIDRSFIPVGDGTAEDEKRKVMLKSIIDMVNSLGLKSIAEGVETIDQVILLKENGCFFAQGYYFDKPLPVEDFEQRLDQLAET
ncbi:MAG: bifunctional diguanylate cyclase/phosphodiesterase [Lachnospiraceae bacterium]|nr:bifunctional diguanylate cyclase/phosphodiesterase [Lachnospiraceae bacterium]